MELCLVWLTRCINWSCFGFGNVCGFLCCIFQSILLCWTYMICNLIRSCMRYRCVREHASQDMVKPSHHLLAVLAESVKTKCLDGSSKTKHLRINPGWSLSNCPIHVFFAYFVNNFLNNTLKKEKMQMMSHGPGGTSILYIQNNTVQKMLRFKNRTQLS